MDSIFAVMHRRRRLEENSYVSMLPHIVQGDIVWKSALQPQYNIYVVFFRWTFVMKRSGFEMRCRYPPHPNEMIKRFNRNNNNNITLSGVYASALTGDFLN